MSRTSTELSRDERGQGTAEAHASAPLSRFLRIEQVMEFTGLPRSTVYEMVARGLLPKPVPVTPRRRLWLEAELLAWRDARVAARDAA